MTTQAIERVQKYLAERAKSRQLHQEEIHSLNVGDDTREGMLLASDLQTLIDAASAAPQYIREKDEELAAAKQIIAELENNGAGRAAVLLKAAYDLLKQQENSRYVLDILTCHAHYDEADCDGHCLLDDIAAELGLER